jgi:hypothetical protein
LAKVSSANFTMGGRGKALYALLWYYFALDLVRK